MNGWILVGEKSANLKDVDIFIKGFTDIDINLKKVFAKDISIFIDENDSIYVNGKKTDLPDFSVSAFFGNYDYHNHSVVKLLEGRGVLCINGYSCLINARDKMKSFLLVKEAVPAACLPKTLLYNSSYSEALIKEAIGFPLVAKINHGAKGNGVHLVNNFTELTEVVSVLEEKYGDEIILQEYISFSKGKDLRVIVCGGKVMTSFLRTNQDSFKSNLNSGGLLHFFKLPKALEDTSLQIAKTLGMNLGSVDFLLGENDKFYFCEANSMPGLSYVKASKDQNITNPLKTIAENIKNQVINK